MAQQERDFRLASRFGGCSFHPFRDLIPLDRITDNTRASIISQHNRLCRDDLTY